MSVIEESSINELLYVLNCKGLSPCIINNKLVIFRGEQVVFAKEVSELFINDLVDLGINVIDSRYISYLIDIAKNPGKRKSLTL